MKIENEFRVEAPIEVAWSILTDIPVIAPCMPGAKLTSVEDDTYTGTIKIKVGPITAVYTGTARFLSKDDSAHRAELLAKGRDSRGSGNAEAVIVAQLEADGDATVVNIDTDLKISGKVAQFGRGVMVDVSKKLIGQFVECLEDKIREEQGEADTDAGPEAAEARTVGAAESDEVEALDLMAFAGGAMLKRLVPVLLAIVVIIVVLLLVI